MEQYKIFVEDKEYAIEMSEKLTPHYDGDRKSDIVDVLLTSQTNFPWKHSAVTIIYNELYCRAASTKNQLFFTILK